MKTLSYRDRLILSGLGLFLLGLLAGFATPAFRNPRLGLSAHLEGVMNGMFLILVGLIWGRLRLSIWKARLALALLLWAGYINWLACLLGAVLGASRMTPIAGGQFSAAPWQENLVAVLFGSVGVTMLLAVLLLIWGFVMGTKNAVES